jgi:hypothetical protein
VRLVFEVKKPQKQFRQLGAVWSRLAQQIRRVAVIIAAMAQSKTGAADRIGRSDAG